MSLSVIIIARNAEATIRRCLESVAWADEIIVVEHDSDDRTAEICRQSGAKVHQTPDWPGFGPQRNRALALARSDWVFAIDSDEWVTPDLRSEMERAMAAPGGKAAFSIPVCSNFCGRWMRHSGWWRTYRVRLARRALARCSDDIVHERAIVCGETGRLNAPLLHHSAPDLETVLTKMNLYSTASAAALHQRGRHALLGTAILHGWWAFASTYFLRLGFLDGREGFMLAFANAEGTYYKYLKLMLLAESDRRQRE